MHIEQGKMYAVLTGDIVNSSKLEEKERIYLHQVMKQCSQEIHLDFARSVPLEVDIFRGDSWQLLVTDPEDALSVGLLYRALIRTLMHSVLIDTRFAIAVGTIDFIPDSRVSSGDGEAFRRSGEALEKMHRGSRMRFCYAGEEGSYLAEAFDMVVQLIDVLAGNWTEKQAQAVAGALRGWTQEEIARSWQDKPITQQAVAQHLDRAGWNAIETGLAFFQKGIISLTRREPSGRDTHAP